MDTIICRDIFIRHTDTDGGTAVRCHRVWDAERFLAAQKAEAADNNGRVEGDGKRLAKAEQITEDHYRQERR